MKLKKNRSIKLTPIAPFNFNPSLHKPSHFPSADSYWKPGTRWQTMLWQKKKLGLKFENQGTVNKPKVKLTVWSYKPLSDQFLDSLITEIDYRYSFGLDLKEFNQKFSHDSQLGPIIEKWKGMRPLNYSSLYEYLIIGLMLQNCTVKRSVQMMQVLFENYGTLLEYDHQKLYCSWKPGGLTQVTEEELRSLRIGYRARSLKRIDDQFAQNSINEFDLRKKDRGTQMKMLLELYGVGPATVWYLLFDVFHHFDFFNHISPWEQKIYSKLFFDQDPENPVPVKKLLKHFEKYQPYQQLAVHYLWEDLWWKRKNKNIPWLEKLIRL
jgi:3-methyladenine DNA glycosylase/8-oxoguanine DNA glycosylase